MRLIDLSFQFYQDMDRRPKFPEIKVELRTIRTIDKYGVNGMQIEFYTHTGTHIDAPGHIIQGAKTIDQLPLESFYGTGVVLNIPKGANGAVSRDDLESAQPPIERGDIVLLHTGWRAECNSPDYSQHHPYLSEDGATFLVEKGVRMVGIDTRSVDLPDSLSGGAGKGLTFTSLRVLLQHTIPVIHRLANLELILGRRVTVMAFPINFRGADGSPARVVALVD
jgi:arylformamidase